ncbi:serendipity locus protein alpha-like isoform X2 [Choristoneura fumiferana]
MNLFDIFKIENEQGILIQDSRQCMLERISWCVNRLLLVEEKLENMQQNQQINDSDVDSLFSTPMYFVNWMDHTFEVLSKLALVIYRTDYKDNDELYCKWKTELLECVRELYTSLDGLLLSAMTLCKYCLSSDQIIVKTRCQVVLREAKVLLSDVIEGHTDGKFSATVDSLKLPIMPTNVNVSIDVLKDVLYVLETNTNTALLALVVYCFSNTMSPVDVLREHFNKTEGYPHQHCGDDNVEEDCDHVREFDLYGERLLQIGSFAVSCSSDQERIVSLRSGLASLEALDPHLVPALMLSPVSAHAALLTDSWRKEVQDIRDSVFLIVDPAAFAEKSKQMMQQNLKQLISKNEYDSSGVHSVIAMGCVVQDFFDVYKKNEPDALTCQDVLLPLLADLEKALLECKVVNNLLSSKDDFVYDVKKPTRTKEVSMEKLFKRLKLLYTLVNRINSLLHPEDNDDLFNSDVEEHVQNGTYTMNPVNGNTYVTSPRKPPHNMTRSVFGKTKTMNIRTPAKRFPIKKLAQHIKAQKSIELNFSVQLDELFNLSEFDKPNKSASMASIPVPKNSILYNFSPKKNRSSLRKMVLNKRYNLISEKQTKLKSEMVVKESLMDETTSLQISEILDQMHDMTKILSTTSSCVNTSRLLSKTSSNGNGNRNNTTISKYIRKIPADASTLEMRLDETGATNATDDGAPSDVSTLERLRDLNRIENKLTNLKLLHKETRL